MTPIVEKNRERISAMKIVILGASSGIGREFVRLLAGEKNEIVAVAYDRAGLDALANEIKSESGTDIETVCRDLTRADELAYVCERYTDCDFLINSVGGGKIGDVSSFTLGEDQYYMNLNMWTLHAVTKTTVQKMIAKKRGMLINVCSLASFAPMPNFSIYAATKAFTGSYTIAVSKEAKKYGVKIMALCPGPTSDGGDFLPDDDNRNGRREKVRGGVLSSTVVARAALKKINKGGIICIPGAMNKFFYLSYKFLPIGLNNAIIHYIFAKLMNRT